MKGLVLGLVLGISTIAHAQISDTGTLRTYINAHIVTNGNRSITAKNLNDVLNGYLNLWPSDSVSLAIGTTRDTLFFWKGNVKAYYLLVVGRLVDTLHSSTGSILWGLNSVLQENSGGDVVSYDKIGIGTRSPKSILNLRGNDDVATTLTIEDDSNTINNGARILLKNNAGHLAQFYLGSSNNAFVPDGFVFDQIAPGGMLIDTRSGPLAFGSFPKMGVSEYARFAPGGNFLIGSMNDLGNGKLQVNGNSYFEGDITSAIGHFLSFTHILGNNQSSNPPTVAAGVGAGTSPTTTLSGGDQDGSITVTTGASPTASSAIVTITYGYAFPNATYVSLTSANAATAALSGTGAVYLTSNKTSFTITSGAAGLAASTTYQWFFHVGGF